MLINDALQEFIYDCEIRKISPRTLKSYRNNNLRFFNYVKQEFNIMELEEFSHLHIKKYFRFLIDKGLTESYANGILKCMRALFVYCINEEYVLVNPCLKVSWQREPKTLINTFTDLEVINMIKSFSYLNYLEARNKTIVALLVDTGIRNAETCSLLTDNIKNYFVLIQGKGNKQRQVGLSPELKKIMMKYNRIKEYYFKDKIINHGNYFLSNTGLPLTVETIERVIKIAGARASVRTEIRCSPHTIRHYFAQKQLRNNLDVYSLSRILGHENVMITKTYLQSIKDEEIVAMSIRTSPLMTLKRGK